MLITDRGTEFYNKTVTKKLDELKITQTPIASYHAQANPVERSNRTIKPIITIFLEGDHKNWDIHLQEFAFAINTSVHSSTMLTPAFLNFGRNPIPPDSYKNAQTNPIPYEKMDQEAWADRLKRLPAIYDLVRKNLSKANERQAKNYNKNRRDVKFEIDNLVLKRTHVLSKKIDDFSAKLAPKYEGPCKIVKIVSPVIYDVKNLNTNKESRVHIQDLKEFVSKNIDDSVQPIGTGNGVSRPSDGSRQRPRQRQATTATAAPPGRQAYNLRSSSRATPDQPKSRPRGRPRSTPRSEHLN